MRVLAEAMLDTGYDYVQNLERQYDLAIRTVEEQIRAWYQRFAGENGLTFAEAKRLLTTKELQEFRWTVEEYIKHGRENALDGRWMKELENASARVHVTRLESLKLQLQQQAELLFGNQLDEFDRLIYKTYSESYAHTAFEIQKGIGVGWQLHKLTSGEIRKMLARPWTTDGQTFSDRIWQNKRALINTVSTQLTQMVMRGTAPDQAIKTIADRFQVSKRQAGRLVMTETAAFANEARKDCFNDLDVEKYVIVETLDGQTCPLCGQLDGKVYPMSDYAVGVTAPPFHPWCRGTTAPWFDDLQGLGYRAARDEKGEYYEVPREMTYSQWKKAFVDGEMEGLKKAAAIRPAALLKRLSKLFPEETASIGAVDFADRDAVLRELDSAETAFAGLEHEACLTVTSDGKMWLTSGEGAMVDAASGIEALGGNLQGSFSYHNHPEQDTWYSFSADDLRDFFQNGAAFAEASDQRFSYIMERTAETLDISPDEVYHEFNAVLQYEAPEFVMRRGGDMDDEVYHETMRILSERYRFRYERMAKNGD